MNTNETLQIQIRGGRAVPQAPLLSGARAGTRGGAGRLQPTRSWSRDERSGCLPASCFPGGVEVDGSAGSIRRSAPRES